MMIMNVFGMIMLVCANDLVDNMVNHLIKRDAFLLACLFAFNFSAQRFH